ncbi:M28 family peptidase [Cardinium endosymbiont of Nabis limbatus]|uniref:M28 family peptidase n=1 Tax=Cardinium endosymbiont of Nabis limbatus TaxID=3066217 RepID=UPI003AF3E9CC
MQPYETLNKHLKQHITYLSKTIGPRNIENEACYAKLCQAAQYIINTLKDIGYQPNITTYTATYDHKNFEVQNIEVAIPDSIDLPNDRDTSNSAPTESIVIGAHYDTVFGSPGADDNGSGIAVLIEIARHMYHLYTQSNDKLKMKRTIKLVAFPNEESPYSLDQQGKSFGNNMGSVQYAKRAKEKGESIIGMISLESIGYFSNEEDSQMYPWYLKWLKYLYGNQGNFLTIIGDLKSRSFQKEWMSCYHKTSPKPFSIHRIALPGCLRLVYRSDHGAFSMEGFPAFMITDTANFRNPNYHKTTDTPETINFSHFTEVAQRLIATVPHLAFDMPYDHS